MTVELRDLRWAIVASQHRSLRQAAVTLNIRQSTLSRCLRDLEYSLKTELFERSNGGTHPTVVGLEFLETARHIVNEVDTAFIKLRSRSRGESGHLTIGVYTALSTGNLHATLREYHRRFPDVEIHTVDGSRIHLLSELASDAIDVAIMCAEPQHWEDRTIPLWSERVVVALPEHHPLSTRRAVHWTELQNECWLINRSDPGADFRQLLSKFGCLKSGHVTEHDVGIDRLLSLVGTGLGPTLVLEGATGASYPGVIYREVYDYDEVGQTRMNFMACWRQANGRPTLIPFLGMLRERYPELSAPVKTATPSRIPTPEFSP